jgi:hypothetical protein
MVLFCIPRNWPKMCFQHSSPMTSLAQGRQNQMKHLSQRQVLEIYLNTYFKSPLLRCSFWPETVSTQNILRRFWKTDQYKVCTKDLISSSKFFAPWDGCTWIIYHFSLQTFSYRLIIERQKEKWNKVLLEKRPFRTAGVAQVLKPLPSKCEVLSPNPSTTKTKMKERQFQ